MRRTVFTSEFSKREQEAIENRGEHSEFTKRVQESIENRGEHSEFTNGAQESIENRGEHSEFTKRVQESTENRGGHSELTNGEQESIENRGEHSEFTKREQESTDNTGILSLKLPSITSLDFSPTYVPISSSKYQSAGDTEEKEGDGIINKKEEGFLSPQSSSRSLKQRELLRRKKQASALLNGSRNTGGEKDRPGTKTGTIPEGSISKDDSEEVSILSEEQIQNKEGGEIDDLGPKDESSSDANAVSVSEGIATSAFSGPFLGLFGY